MRETDPHRRLDKIRAFADVGFTHFYRHRVGPDQEDLFGFARRERPPAFGG